MIAPTHYLGGFEGHPRALNHRLIKSYSKGIKLDCCFKEEVSFHHIGLSFSLVGVFILTFLIIIIFQNFDRNF